MNWAVHAKNALANVHGFSPYQLVFGRNPSLPGVLTDRPPAFYEETSTDIIRENLNALHKAREAFIRSESSEKVRRALRHNVRTSADVRYVNGDSVYYKRINDKKWKGPAKVLGQDGQQVLVKHGGVYVRVHPCRLSLERRSERTPEGDVQNTVPENTKETEQGNGDDCSNSETEDGDTSDEESENDENTGRSVSELAHEAEDTVQPSAAPDVEQIQVNAQNSRSVSESNTKLKKNVSVEYKLTDGTQWLKGGVLSRAGKAGGKYGNCWNLIDGNGKINNVDFDRHVDQWRIIDNVTAEESTEGSHTENSTEEPPTDESPTEEPPTEVSPTEVHYIEIFNTENKEETLEAKLREIESWKKNAVFEEVDNTGQQCVSVRWVITPKIIDGLVKVKARLVARGFEETSNFRTDSPTCLRESVRVVLFVIASHKWVLHSLDYKTAFLQGKAIDRDVYLRPPSEFRNKNKIWKLRKTVYGLADAPRVWFLRLREEILRLGAKESSLDNGVFYWFVNGRLEGIMACFVDDQLWGGSSSFAQNVIEKLRTTFEISHEHESAFKYVGIELIQDDDFSIRVNQKNYINSIVPIDVDSIRRKQKDEELNSDERRKYRGLIGQLSWVSGMSRPDIAFAVCQLSTLLQNATVKDILRANKVVKYLKGNQLDIKIPTMENLEALKIVSYSDASWANLPCGGSQGGFVIFIVNSESLATCPIMWRSNKIKRVVRSTIAAETLAFLDGSERAVVLAQAVGEIYGIRKVPITGITDNKSLYDSAHTTKTLTDPRLKVDMAIVRQMVEREEVQIRWVQKEEQLADCLTKQGASAHKIQQALSYGSIDLCE